MEIEKVRELLTEVALSHHKADDSRELKALRNISLALLHVAEGIVKIQAAQAASILPGRG
jgi:tRNA threonylcarbamoyladenosine modification (KEOPS) complex  Pcc1 subunit